jgi:hypothetical protein
MVLNLRPKCANPSCAASFEWLAGGRLFRFRRDSGEAVHGGAQGNGTSNSHAIGHYWLCERCSNVYTLHFEPGRGVTLAPLWPELRAAEYDMHLPAVEG